MLTKRILAGLAFAACAAFMIPSEVEASGRYGGGYGNHSQGQGFAGQNCRQVSPRHVQCTRRVYRSSRTYGHASRSRQTYGGYAQERPIAARPVYNKPRRAAATTCCRSASPTVATASANANGNGGKTAAATAMGTMSPSTSMVRGSPRLRRPQRRQLHHRQT